ncbi:MAG TPA: hypothetical protein VEB40_05420 [Flavipsychrobacter sp.]|nr:hypothetical protein [Flavipsychrobacter sp.]
MTKDFLSQLIDKTFAKLSCPTPGIGLYNELRSVITTAFEFGKEQESLSERFHSTHTSTHSTGSSPEMTYSGPLCHP